MFKKRLLTTLVLIPLVLFAIYYAYFWILVCVISLLVLLAGIEWTHLMPASNKRDGFIYLVVLMSLLWLSSIYYLSWALVGFLVWLFVLGAVLTFPLSQSYWGKSSVVGACGWVLLPLFANSLGKIYLMPLGKDLLVYLLCLVWAADVGAYLSGKGFGHTKLIPKVSPGKTLEGLLGGLFFALLVASIGYFYFEPIRIMLWFALATFLVFISILGDLFISVLKRRCKLKDTGRIFPGHGGVLDRLDSLIAASPFFYCGIRLFPLGL